jgi:hypothetical protein
MAYKSTTGKTPYYLVYGQNAIMPVAFEIQTHQVFSTSRLPDSASQHARLLQLDILEEDRLLATTRVETRQAARKSLYDKNLKPLAIKDGNFVLLYDSRYAHFPGKLLMRWLGPYIVHQLFPNRFAQLRNLAGHEKSTRSGSTTIGSSYIIFMSRRCLD